MRLLFELQQFFKFKYLSDYTRDMIAVKMVNSEYPDRKAEQHRRHYSRNAGGGGGAARAARGSDLLGR